MKLDKKSKISTPPSPATQGDVFPFKLGKRAGTPGEVVKAGPSGVNIMCSLDVECMKTKDNVQIPISISFAYLEDNIIKSFVILINKDLLIFI